MERIPLHIRPANEDDVPRIQALYDSLMPIAVPSAHHLIQAHHVRIAELDAGTVVGFRSLSPSGFVWIAISEEHKRQGIGSRLMKDALEQASALGFTELTSQADDDNTAGNAFCVRFNFQPFLHFVNLSLDLTHWDESPLISALEQAQAASIRFMTYAELGDSEENRQRLYALNKTLSATIPRDQPQPFISFETYVKSRLSGPKLPHEGISIALDDAEWVGMSQISLEEDYAFNHMTGVLPHYRGSGVAQALKLLVLRFAQRNCTIIRTFNDVTNAPMIAVNEKAGFRRGAQFRRLRRKPVLQQ